MQATRVRTPSCPPHSLLDDLQALGTALVLLSLGLTLLASAGLAVGGAPGLAFLVSYATGWPLGPTLLLVNLPFYLLGWVSLGGRFTVRTLIAAAGLAGGVELARSAITVQIAPPYAALAGGVLIGAGLLVMLRHGGSLGGVGILALHLQRRFGWSLGWVQLGFDVAILGAACLVLSPGRLAWSVATTGLLNAVLILNHRPGRYRWA